MGRVIWINGCFSTGKTTVATLVIERLGSAFLLDPEVIGTMLRDRLLPPPLDPGDFQDLHLWRSFTREVIADAAARYDGFIVVPMTIARADYFAEVVGAISRRVRVDHFTLMASRETILRRESLRPDDTGGWAQQTVDRVLPALEDARFAVHVDADRQSAPEVAEEILQRLAA